MAKDLTGSSAVGKVLTCASVGAWWNRLRNSRVAQNTVSLLAGNMVTMLIQAVYFVLIARSLGPAQYGGFIGAVSFIAILAPFSTWGTGGILVRNVARDKTTFPQSFGNAILVTGVSGSLLLIIVLLLSRVILSNKVPLLVLLLVGTSDLLLVGVVSIAGQAYQAFEMLGGLARVGVVLAAVRAVGAFFLFLLFPHPDAIHWSMFYVGTTGIAGAYAFIGVCRRFGFPSLALRCLKGDIREGFYFSVSLSSQSIYNNIDKTMMVRLATLGAAGVYATAYRILDVAFQPVSSFLYSTYAKFFQHGSLGIRGAARYARHLLPYALAYGTVASALLFTMAPLLPLVIGRKFIGADEALRWLSPIVLFRVIHYFFSNSLTGANFQGLRCGVQVGVAAFNAILNLWLIPAYSWRGAAWASLASDGLLAISIGVATLLLVAREKMPEHPPEAQTTDTV